jgi:ligand-binding sensor protein
MLQAIASELGMVATLVDPQGKILLHAGDYPDVCIRVRKKAETLTFVCGQTSQVMMKQAEKTREPAVDLCQIGLCKMVIPVFQGDRFLGALTACARALVGEELDPFMVARELDISEEEAGALLESTPQVDEEKVNEVAQTWAERIQQAMVC